MAISDIESGFGDIAKSIKSRKEKRDMETVKDSILVQMAKSGAKQETLDLIGNLKAENPVKLVSAIKDLQDIIKATPAGQDEEIKRKVKESTKIAEAKEKAKSDAKLALSEEEDAAKAQTTARGTYRFLQQFNRSYEELKAFDPNVDADGFGGWMTRNAAKLGEKVDAFPETSALIIQVQPMANEMARDIEGGKITDQDRKIYADSFASAINHPTKANIRSMSSSIVRLLDKGGDKNGAISNQLKELASTNSDIFNGVIRQVLLDYPELAEKIYGEGAKVKE